MIGGINMLTKLFQTAAIKDIKVLERMKAYKASFKFNIENAPVFNYFLDIIKFVPQRDEIRIFLEDETERTFNFSNASEESYNEYIKDTLDDEIIDVRIKIDKEVVNNHFSVYSFDKFVEDILSLSIEDVMIEFSDLLKQASATLIFDIYSQATIFATKTMSFIPYGNEIINTEFNRKQRIEECKEVSYFYNFDNFFRPLGRKRSYLSNDDIQAVS